MEIEEISTAEKVVVGGITLLTIVYTRIICRRAGRGMVSYATKNPVAVLVTSPQGNFALDMEGKAVPLSQFAGIPGVPD